MQVCEMEFDVFSHRALDEGNGAMSTITLALSCQLEKMGVAWFGIAADQETRVS